MINHRIRTGFIAGAVTAAVAFAAAQTAGAQTLRGTFPMAIAVSATHDEDARDVFVVDLKQHINVRLSPGLKATYEHRAGPAFEQTHGRAFANRHEVRRQMENEPYFQTWGSLWRLSQEQMWDAAQTKFVRQQDEMTRSLVAPKRKTGGTLRLDPSLAAPGYVADVDIHAQPGGYCLDEGPEDITAAGIKAAVGDMYARGQGRPGKSRPVAAVAKFLKQRYPELKPARILDEGCGIGTATAWYMDAFPEAEMHAIDVSASFVRYAHAQFEEQGRVVHFAQMNAEATDYPDDHFDLIVSNIMMHETSSRAARNILKECYRILRPGGIAIHTDVPLRNRDLDLYTEWYRDWSTHYNNEPFWGTLHDLTMADLAVDAGFARDEVIDDYIPSPTGGRALWACGGRKT